MSASSLARRWRGRNLRRALAGYGLAVLSSLLALGLMLVLSPYMDPLPYVLFFAAVFISAWYGGAGPGVVATFLTAILVVGFVLQLRSRLVFDQGVMVPLMAYVTVSILTASLVAKLRRKEKEWRESERKFRAVFEKSLDAIGVSKNGYHVMVNPAYLTLFGYERTEELTGQSVLLLNAASHRAMVADRIQRRGRGEPAPARYESRGRRKDGTEFDMEVDVATFELEGEQNTLVILRDITERKHAEQAVRSLNVALEQQVARRTAQLEEAYQELEAFSYSVSHDLRAPIRGIDGLARILREEHAPTLDAEAQQLLALIGANAGKMNQLIDDLLQFSLLIRRDLNAMEVDMTDLARSVVQELTQAEPGRAVEVVVGNLPATKGDRALLRQVFVNLVSNALKFTRRHPAPAIEIGGGVEAQEVVYSVRDNGVGFDMNYADKLFKVFQRLHQESEFEGTGVGLALVQRIIHRHGGRVWAEGEPDRGACFHFALPQAGADSCARPTQRVATPSLADSPSKAILGK